jgi:hypothetical protein
VLSTNLLAPDPTTARRELAAFAPADADAVTVGLDVPASTTNAVPTAANLADAARTGLPLGVDTRARPPRPPRRDTPVEARASATSRRLRFLLVVAVTATLAWLTVLVSVLLPWSTSSLGGGLGDVGSPLGVGALVVHTGLVAAVIVDLVERRLRWTALVAVPPLILLALVACAATASAVSGRPLAAHLAGRSIPWAGPVTEGVVVFGAGQVAALVAGIARALAFARHHDADEAPASPSPRRAAVVAVCAVACLGLIVGTGSALAAWAMPEIVPAATVTSAL